MRAKELQSAISQIYEVEKTLKEKETTSVRMLKAARREMELELIQVKRAALEGL